MEVHQFVLPTLGLALSSFKSVVELFKLFEIFLSHSFTLHFEAKPENNIHVFHQLVIVS